MPCGSFTYKGDSEQPLVLISGGVGLTPLMSMLDHIIASGGLSSSASHLSEITSEDRDKFRYQLTEFGKQAKLSQPLIAWPSCSFTKFK